MQRRFLVAIWGMEIALRPHDGPTPVFQALATLAWEPRRAALFRGELFDALTMVQRGHIEADTMTGSWAGAMGQTQFMPSSYLKFAVDFDGDEPPRHLEVDARRARLDRQLSQGLRLEERRDLGPRGHASAPLRRRGSPRRSPSGPKAATRIRNMTERRPLAEWQKLGVRRIDGGPLPKADIDAGLVDVGERKFLVYSELRRDPRLQLRALLRAHGRLAGRSTSR